MESSEERILKQIDRHVENIYNTIRGRGTSSQGGLFGGGGDNDGSTSTTNDDKGKKFADKGEKIAKSAEKLSKTINKVKVVFEGLADVVQGVIKIFALGNELKNIKAGAKAEALKYNVNENQLQFQRDSTLNKIQTEKLVNEINVMGDIALKQLEAQGNIMLQSLKIMAETQVRATEIAVGPLIEGINESAYKAAEYAIDRKKDLALFDVESKKISKQTGLSIGLSRQQYELQNIVLEKQGQLAKAQYTGKSAQNSWDKAIAIRDAASKSILTEVEGAGEIGKHIGQGVGTIGGAVAGGGVASAATAPLGYYLGGQVGKYAGYGIGLVNASKDKTGEYAHNYGDTASQGMVNVFQKNNRFSRPTQDYRNSDLLTSKWDVFWDNAIGLTANREKETLFSAQLGKMTAGLEMQYEGSKQLTENTNQILNTKLSKQVELQTKSIDIQTEALKTSVETQANLEKIWLKLAQNNEKLLGEFDKTTNNLGIGLGYTNRNQLSDFQNTMFTAANAAAKFGKTIEEAAEVQNRYIEETGRNRLFDQSDYTSMFGLGKILGDDSLAAQYASEMEIFNVGVSDSVNMLGEVLEDVNRIGLNGRKYTKILVDNLKLAQKYNFKGGTKGLMEMAKWAQNTRFNLSSLGNMVDDIMDGSIENIITKGAQFQVLGGATAMNADPFAMMYEAGADPEALAKRYQDMTRDIGEVDKVTGETKFNWLDDKRIREIAKIQGRSTEELRAEIMARRKKGVVSKQLNDKFNEDELSYISNNAEFNKEKGRFEIKTWNGQEYEKKDVSALTREDLGKLMPEEHEERVEDYMQKILSCLEKIAGTENKQKNALMEKTYEEYQKNIDERIKISEENFAKHYNEYVNNSIGYTKLITKHYGDFTRMFEDANKEVDEQTKKIIKMAESIEGALAETADVIKKANAMIKQNSENEAALNATDGNKLSKEEKVKKAMDEISQWKKEHVTKGYQYSNTGGFNAYGGMVYTETKNYTQDQLLNAENEILAKYGLKKRDSSKNLPTIKGNDFYLSPNQSIITKSDNVTKINDGLIESHPKDKALFAKTGGPFDTLFNGVLSRVNDMYDMMNTVLPNSYNKGIYNNQGNRQGNVNGGLSDLNLKVSGSIKLESNGNSVTMNENVFNNPSFIREFGRVLVESLRKDNNGGMGKGDLMNGAPKF